MVINLTELEKLGRETKTAFKTLIRIVPLRTLEKMDKVITSRFTGSEKEEIDNVVKEYGTTLTDLVRNAIFYYIKVLEKKEKS
jgi:hypothetical protein